MDKRRFIAQLPAINQTETLKKFFGSTVDQVFQPGEAEAITGYIGKKPHYYNPTTDFYIREPSALREAHQLEPTMVSQQNGEITNILFYDDLINYIKSNNGNVDRHDRMFDGRYYSWAPPVDIDKLSNHRHYYWFGDNPSLVPALTLTAAFKTTIADGETYEFPLPEAIVGVDATREVHMAFENDFPARIEDGMDGMVRFARPPVAGTIITTYRYGDLREVVANNVNFDPRLFTEETRVETLTSSMRIAFKDAIHHRLRGFDVMPFEGPPASSTTPDRNIEWDTDLAVDSYWVEGVGVNIELIPVNLDPDAEVRKPLYVAIDRRSADWNPWSRNNFWVHLDAFSWAGVEHKGRVAERPIIEFVKNLKLHKYGTKRRADIHATLSGDILYCPANLNVFPGEKISDWDVLLYDKQSLESNGFVSIPVQTATSKTIGTLWVDKHYRLGFGDRVLVLNNSDPEINHRILTVRQGQDVITEVDYGNGTLPVDPPVTGMVMVVDVSEAAREGDVVRMRRRGPVPLESHLGFDFEEWDHSSQPIEWFYNGTAWVEAQERHWTSTDPLFSLYTEDHEPYDLISESFSGNRILGYAQGSGNIDRVLERRLRHDTNGQIVFENDLVTRRTKIDDEIIDGFQYYLIYGEANQYGNAWHAVSEVSEQKIIDGFYEVPLNLAANPNNEDVEFISRNEWHDQFSNLVNSQTGLVGTAISNNNWRDTARDLSLGRKIVQHRSPLLKAMLLASDERFDYFNAVRYVEQEYTRFRNKFCDKALELLASGALGLNQTADVWVDAILHSLNFAKTAEFPFALSTVGGENTFIPPTPASLGLLAPVEPSYVNDDTYSSPLTVLVGHDGSRTPIFGDVRDVVMLALEQRIYRQLKPKFKDEIGPAYDFWKVVSGRARPVASSRFLYSRDEIVSILTPFFMRWVQNNGFDHRANEGYDANNPFTWNYRGVLDRDGVEMPGHWRGIYRWYFDTDRPHLSPWEMLGFASKPSWWETHYGTAPYTSGNRILWDDIRDGRIADGPRAGIDTRFARPDIWDILPVDINGNLRNPIETKIIPHGPTFSLATRDWVVGDHAPVENLWINSPSYGFAKALLGAIMRPAEWIETGFDTGEFEFKNGQWVNSEVNARAQNSRLTVHGEIGKDGERVRVTGIQQWIVEHMLSQAMDPSKLGNAIRGLDVRLAHKMAGFTHARDLRIFTDNFGIIPNEDINVLLHQSPPFRTTFYSGLIIEWVGDGWSVVGYDNTTESFTIMPGDPTSIKHTVALAETPPIYEWRPNVHYPINRLVEHKGSVYTSVAAHTSGQSFEEEFWRTQPGTQKQYPKVVVYDNGTGETKSVAYNTVFSTYQEVAEFIRDYFRWLEHEGFVFDHIDPVTGTNSDWRSTIREFLSWAQMQWQPGNFIALSPAASSLKFVAAHGTVFNVEQSSNGVYGVIDRAGRSMSRHDSFVSRLDEETKIISRKDDLYGARLRIGEIEHVIVFANRTLFNDIIYDPLLNIKQPRLRLLGSRAKNWHGRLDAPGYVIDGPNMLPNFDRASENLRTMFEVEHSEDRTLRDYARHVIGFQPRGYLDNLLVSNTQQFEFYQGLIQSKGTVSSFKNLTRTRTIENGKELWFLEEWGFLKSRFGAVRNNAHLRFGLTTGDIHSNPQVVVFGEKHEHDGIIGLPADDLRWIERPINMNLFPAALAQDQFPDFTDGLDERDFDVEEFDPIPAIGGPQVQQFTRHLPTAGYVRRDEVDLAVFNKRLMDQLYHDAKPTPNFFREGTTVWNYDRGDGTFEVLNAFRVGSSLATMRRIVSQKEDQFLPVGFVRILFTAPHDLTPADEGLPIVFTGKTWTDNDLEGVHIIEKVESDVSIIVPGFVVEGYDYTGTADDLGPIDPNPAPNVLILRSMRFARRADARLFWLRHLPDIGQLVYVDNADDRGNWGVYRWDGDEWKLFRQKPQKIDNTRIDGVSIYDFSPDIGTNTITNDPMHVRGINVLDPVAGLIPGIVDKEITYKSITDPAQYFDDSDNIWGVKQVGTLWWDLSTIRVLETETDIINSGIDERTKTEMDYRVANWGQYAPGSTVDVYEWTRSYTHPYDYAIYEGEILNPDEPNFVSVMEYHTQKMQRVPVYYFWVRNSTTIPQIKGRSHSAMQIAAWISHPKPSDFPWVAMISSNTLLVGGIEQYLNSASSIFEIKLKIDQNENNVHTEWQLVRPEDQREEPPADLWHVLRDSLTGFNDLGSVVPDPNLPVEDRLGISLRPRQTMFSGGDAGRRQARAAFVTKLNQFLQQTNLLARRDSTLDLLSLESPDFKRLIWTQQPGQDYIIPPPPNSWDFIASSIEERNEIVYSGQFFDFDYDHHRRKPRILLANLTASPPSWSVWEVDPDKLEDDIEAACTLASNYDVEYQTYADMAEAARLGKIERGTRVIVRNDALADNMWTCWSYNPAGNGVDKNGFVYLNAQLYRTADFFEQVDWFAEGYSDANPPIITYDSDMERNMMEGETPVNTFVKVNTGHTDDHGAFWHWYTWKNGWEMVGHQRGTIRLKDTLYAPNRTRYGVPTANLTDAAMRDGSWELRILINLLRNIILTAEQQNELFFSMLHFIHAQGIDVPWAFKTSFMTIYGHTRHCKPSPVQEPDHLENLLHYINEVKPYRVKIRDYANTYEAPFEKAYVAMFDFDKPLYWDTYRKKYRVLNPNVVGDAYIIQTEEPFKSWYSKYMSADYNPESNGYNPVRRMNVKLRFDRIDPRADQPLEVGYGWDYLAYDEFKFDETRQQIEAAGSAFSRMLRFYHPTNGMRENTAETLLRLGFRGVVVEGGDLFVATQSGDLTEFDIRAFDEMPLESIIPTEHDVHVDVQDDDHEVVYNGSGGTHTMVDPVHGEWHPEELIQTGNTESVMLRVHTEATPGGPHQSHRTMSNSNPAATTATLSFDVIPADNNSLMVYLDGVRALPSEYTVDHFGRKVTVNLGSPAATRVTIHVFGSAGITGITEQRYYSGDGGSTFTLMHTPGDDVVEVIVDGVIIPENEITVVGKIITLANPVANGVSVMVNVRARLEGDPDAITTTYLNTETLVDNPSQEWTLGVPSQIVPQHLGTILEVNGERALPPFTRFGHFDATNRAFEFKLMDDASDMKIWLDNVQHTGHIAVIQSGIVQEAVLPIDYEGAYDTTTFDDADLWDVEGEIAVIDGYVCAIHASLNARSVVAVAYDDAHEYDVENNLLAASTVLDSGDRIEATTFTNDQYVGLQTHVFHGNTDGEYVVETVAEDYLVTLDGKVLTRGVDYVSTLVNIQDRNMIGETVETTHIGRIIRLSTSQTDNQRIIVMTFAGRKATIESDWAALSTRPGLDMMGELVYDVNSNIPKVEMSEQGPRNLFRMNGSWDLCDFSEEHCGVLISEIDEGTTSFEVQLIGTDTAEEFVIDNPLPAPDMEFKRPGAIVVNGERIEYYSMTRVGDVVTLGELRRGTRGTAMVREDRKVAVVAGDGVTTDFRLAGALTTSPVEVMLVDAENIYVHQLLNVDYTLSQDGDDVVVTMNVAPEDTKNICIAQTGDLRHEAGASVNRALPSPVLRNNPFRLSMPAGVGEV